MADLNGRQITHIQRVQQLMTSLENIYAEAFAVTESYAEEFASGQDNDLAGSSTEISNEYGFEVADFTAAVNQSAANFINYWTGSAVTTREYGKDARRVRP